MRLTRVADHLSINNEIHEGDLPNPLLITGANGAGKSQLLAAILTGAVQIDDIVVDHNQGSNVSQASVRSFQFDRLNPVYQQNGLQVDQYRGTWRQFLSAIEHHKQTRTHEITTGYATAESREAENALLHQALIAGGAITQRGITEIESRTSQWLIDLTADDLRHEAPLSRGLLDPFSLKVEDVFLSYVAREDENYVMAAKVRDGRISDTTALSPEQFVDRFGVEPWIVLNNVLADIGLPYRFEPPPSADEDATYSAMLVDTERGIRISALALSSGERTLLTIALSLYVDLARGQNFALPKVLLLDETDATLHPAMTKSLLNLVQGTLVDKFGLRVLLTTHSPTTVALAPESSIYVMTKDGTPRLRKVSRDLALQSLSAGLPLLSVSIENRRQVIVESEYDEDCYTNLYSTVKQHLNSERSLEFIASGRGGQGNRGAVEQLVQKLRSAGNVSVFGLIDRDTGVEGLNEGIKYLPDRYSLENLLLDPVMMTCLLLRDGDVTMSEVGLGENKTYSTLGPEDAGAMSAFFTSVLVESSDDPSTVDVEYVGDFVIPTPRFVLECRGHDLEDRTIARYAGLNRYKRRLKQELIRTVFREFPMLVPLDAHRIFLDLLKS